MGRRLVAGGRFSLEVEVIGPVLDEALEHDRADEVLKCALIAALSVLAQDGPWPDALLQAMTTFMTDMKGTLRQDGLT